MLKFECMNHLITVNLSTISKIAKTQLQTTVYTWKSYQGDCSCQSCYFNTKNKFRNYGAKYQTYCEAKISINLICEIFWNEIFNSLGIVIELYETINEMTTVSHQLNDHTIAWCMNIMPDVFKW